MRRYYAEYHCVFYLKRFPFDTQVCEMSFKMRTATKQFVELRNGGLNYRASKQLVEFEIKNLTMLPGSATATRCGHY